MHWPSLLALALVACAFHSANGVGSLGSDFDRNARPSNGPLYGVTYSPFALDLGSMCLPVYQVNQDMQIIREVADHVRLYNIAVCPDVTQVRTEPQATPELNVPTMGCPCVGDSQFLSE